MLKVFLYPIRVLYEVNDRNRYCPPINLCLAAPLVLVLLLWLCLGPCLLIPVLLQVLVVELVLFV